MSRRRKFELFSTAGCSLRPAAGCIIISFDLKSNDDVVACRRGWLPTAGASCAGSRVAPYKGVSPTFYSCQEVSARQQS